MKQIFSAITKPVKVSIPHTHSVGKINAKVPLRYCDTVSLLTVITAFRLPQVFWQHQVCVLYIRTVIWIQKKLEAFVTTRRWKRELFVSVPSRNETKIKHYLFFCFVLRAVVHRKMPFILILFHIFFIWCHDCDVYLLFISFNSTFISNQFQTREREDVFSSHTLF